MIRILNRRYEIKPHRGKPFRVLIGVVLSHRTTDEVSWPATDRLFKLAKNPEQMLKLSEKKIAKTIYPTGFYNVKAKRIRQICKVLIEKFDGKVPGTRTELMELPGVGGKSSDIVLSFGFGKPVIA
ncbi:MAG: endonuclease III, partial [Candidatus Aenigmatarchaeota archaeon]